MIVLDEQLLGRGVETQIQRWYRGTVCYITDLRPNTVIKDEAIPLLLRQQRQATFITINESDFWQRIASDQSFCVMCFALPDARVQELPTGVRRVLQNPLFRTKSQRMGCILRVTNTALAYYTYHNPRVRSIEL
jgi:hypothetical protein